MNRATVYYAEMPIMSTRIDYLVQVKLPIELVPDIVSISYQSKVINSEVALKDVLFHRYGDIFHALDIKDMDSIDLIKCSILTPL